MKLDGEEHVDTVIAANNYASSLNSLQRVKEAQSLLRKTIPVARRVVGDTHEFTLKMRWSYAVTLCKDSGATLDDIREAVATLEDAARIARRMLGSAHPLAAQIEECLQNARDMLRACETPSPRT